MSANPGLCELNPLGETTNHGQLGCVIVPGCCAAAREWLDSNTPPAKAKARYYAQTEAQALAA